MNCSWVMAIGFLLSKAMTGSSFSIGTVVSYPTDPSSGLCKSDAEVTGTNKNCFSPQVQVKINNDGTYPEIRF